MRVVVHDYAGHPFPVALSRELARRGHHVLHLYCASIVGPRGMVAPAADDPPAFAVEGVGIGRPFAKYSPLRRPVDEVDYGRAAAARIDAFDPRVVLSANTPLLSQWHMLAAAHGARRRFVYWWQDSYGVGARSVARRRWPALAGALAWAPERLEGRLLRTSDRVVAISGTLRDRAVAWGVDPADVEVVPNWAPLDEVEPGPAENPWKAAHGLAGRPVALYTGTLGLKHDPTLLVDLAVALAPAGAAVAVVSEGPGRRLLEERRRALGLDNLVLVDYQPAEVLGEVLAAADVLVAILEADAGAFSVPSKVLTYLCAGRPVVASLPLENDAAGVLRASEAGVCVGPGDREGFVAAVAGLIGDPARRAELGASGRRWAERNFDQEAVGDRFERILAGALPAPHRLAPAVAAGTVRRIWRHPETRGRRATALARYAAWQAWQRTVGRPWTVTVVPGRRIRCHPHSSAGSAVLYFGLPDSVEMRFLLDYLHDGDAFLDVGANLGVYSVLASSVAGVRVVAVEPSTASFARLRENLELNGLDGPVTAVQAALGRRSGQARLSTTRDAMNAVVADDSAPAEVVPLTTVDDLVAEHGLGRVAAVKVDVEGMELEVLAGAAATLARDRPVLVVEVNDPERLAAFAADHGYTCVRYDPGRRRLEPAELRWQDGGNALLVAGTDAVVARLGRG